MCHSMWQWNNHTPVQSQMVGTVTLRVGQPTGIVGLKPDDKVAERMHDQRVAAHWHCRERRVIGSVVIAVVLSGA